MVMVASLLLIYNNFSTDKILRMDRVGGMSIRMKPIELPEPYEDCVCKSTKNAEKGNGKKNTRKRKDKAKN